MEYKSGKTAGAGVGGIRVKTRIDLTQKPKNDEAE
jgi:hypothetical protein